MLSYFKTSIGELVYHKVGEGQKTLVFLHGFLGRPVFLETLHEKFSSKGYGVVAPILPGHGKSFALPEGFSFSDLYTVVEEFLTSLNAKEITLIGHSMGGGLSWQLGQKSKLPISKIVLLSPGLGKYHKNLDYVSRFARDLKFDYPKEWFVKYFLHAIKEEGQWQQIVFPWRMAQMVRSTVVDFNDFPKGRQVLALWGKDDLITPFADHREKLENIKNLKIKFLPGGHLFYVVRKEQFFSELERFLS